MVMYRTPLLLCADGDMYIASFMLMYILSCTPYMLTVVMQRCILTWRVWSMLRMHTCILDVIEHTDSIEHTG